MAHYNIYRIWSIDHVSKSQPPFQSKKQISKMFQTTSPPNNLSQSWAKLKVWRHKLLFPEAHDALTSYPTAQPYISYRVLSCPNCMLQRQLKAIPKGCVCCREWRGFTSMYTTPQKNTCGRGSYLVWQVAIHSTCLFSDSKSNTTNFQNY